MRQLVILLMILVIATAILVLYGQSQKHQRLPIDRTVVWWNEAVTGDGVGGALMGHFYDSSRDGWHGTIRPVSTVALRTHYNWFRHIRTGYQMMQIMWMTLTCILAMWLFRGARRSPWRGAIGGLLFAVHPLASGSVLNIAGIGELLALAFLISGYLLLQPLVMRVKESLRRDPSGRGADVSFALPVTASAVCFLLALWSHELAMAGLPVLIVWMWAAVRSGLPNRATLVSTDGRNSAKRTIPVILGIPAARAAVLASGIAFVLFIAHRLFVFGMLPDHLKNGNAVLTTTGIGWFERVWLGLQSGPTVLELVFFPIRLGYAHDHLIVSGPGVAGAVVGLALLGGLAVLMVRGIMKGNDGLALWSAWSLFFLVGAMGLVVNPGDIAPGRLVFLSLPGFIGLALIAVEDLMRRLDSPSTKWALLAVCVAVCALLGMRTHSRAAEYDGEETLIRAQLRDFPNSAQGHFDKGNFYLTRGQWAAAQAEYETALALRPEFSMAWVNLGNVYFSQNEYGLAMRSYLFALAETDGRPEFTVVEARAEYHRALILMQQNRNEEAVVALRKMIEVFPDHLPSHANLGFIYSNAPAYEAEARYHLNRAISLETDPKRRKTLDHHLELIDIRRGRIGEESPLPPSITDDSTEHDN